MREFHDFANGRKEFVQLGLHDRQRRGRFQNHKVITAHFGENFLVAMDSERQSKLSYSQ